MFNGGTICLGCRLQQCDKRCPSAEEPRVMGRCDKCREPIRAGERAFRIGQDVFCESCADPQELAEFYGWDGWEDLE